MNQYLIFSSFFGQISKKATLEAAIDRVDGTRMKDGERLRVAVKGADGQLTFLYERTNRRLPIELDLDEIPCPD
jgi:hypothetical protein